MKYYIIVALFFITLHSTPSIIQELNDIVAANPENAQTTYEQIVSTIKEPAHLQHMLSILFLSHCQLKYTLLTRHSMNHLRSLLQDFKKELALHSIPSLLKELEYFHTTLNLFQQAHKQFDLVTDYLDQDSCKEYVFTYMVPQQTNDALAYYQEKYADIQETYSVTHDIIEKYNTAFNHIAKQYRELSLITPDNAHTLLDSIQKGTNYYYLLDYYAQNLLHDTQKVEAYALAHLVRSLLHTKELYEKLYDFMNEHHKEYCTLLSSETAILPFDQQLALPARL